ncbi:MAG: hypothetical protein WCK49_05325 [Myxococcaceae bacterium]
MSTATQFASSVNSLNLNTNSGGAVKTSSNVEFSRTLKNSMAQGASLTYQSVAPVAPFVPGGAIMSAMLHNTTATLASEGIAPGAVAPMPGAASLPGASGNTGMFQSMQQLQENMMSQNVYMLGLQQGFNDMNQKYTAISNVLKTKHDTEKNAISNFR